MFSSFVFWAHFIAWIEEIFLQRGFVFASAVYSSESTTWPLLTLIYVWHLPDQAHSVNSSPKPVGRQGYGHKFSRQTFHTPFRTQVKLDKHPYFLPMLWFWGFMRIWGGWSVFPLKEYKQGLISFNFLCFWGPRSHLSFFVGIKAKAARLLTGWLL